MRSSRNRGGDAQRAEYMARINRVLDHVGAHLDEELSLAALADLACFSRFHFHRIFKAAVGETLMQHVQRRRLERAAWMLRYHHDLTVTAIALRCGFGSSASFARAFKEHFGASATDWRAGAGGAGNAAGDGMSGAENSNPDQALGKPAKALAPVKLYTDPASGTLSWRLAMNRSEVKVEVKALPERTVAYLRHIGPYQGDSALFERLFQKLFGWAGPRGLLRFPATEILALYHDDPDVTDAEKLRLDVCVTVPPEAEVGGEIGKAAIPAGDYAVARFELLPHEYGDAWKAVLGDWLPQSGYQCDDRPCYERYLNDPKQHPEGKHLVEIHVPVKPL